MTQELVTTTSFLSEARPPKPHFTHASVPDQTGHVVLVTGANTGIGWNTAEALYAKGAKVYVGARNADKARAALERLRAAHPTADAAKLVWLDLDLGDLRKVRKAAEEFLEKEERLDQLYCSAGVMTPPKGSVTAQGIEQQLGTNVVAHHFLIKLLLPALEKAASAKGGAPGSARVCLTSSSGHHLHPGGFTKADPEKKEDKRYQSGISAKWNLYGHSKYGNVLDAKAWARRVGDKGISVTSCNPGNLKTELQRHQSGLMTSFINLFTFPSINGSYTQLFANTAPEAAGLNGRFLVPWARVGKEHDDTNKEEQQEDRE